MSSQSKDNTCPTCKNRRRIEVPALPGQFTVCDHCSGQQDKYANSIPKTYEEKQQDKLKPYKPGQQEDKPVCRICGDAAHFGKDCSLIIDRFRLLPPNPPQAPIPDGVMQDSKPEKPLEFKTIYTPEPQLSAWGEHLRTSATPNHTHNDECKREFGFSKPEKPHNWCDICGHQIAMGKHTVRHEPSKPDQLGTD